MFLQIHISNTSNVPIYEQISRQIAEQIMTGELCEGDALPSMRILAKELRISVITTKRAYEELERDGLIASVQGRGSFVAPKNTAFIREEMLKKIEKYMDEVIRSARLCGMSIDELQEMLTVMYEEGDNE